MPGIARVVAPGRPHHVVQRGNQRMDMVRKRNSVLSRFVQGGGEGPGRAFCWALRIGLVSSVVPDTDLAGAARAVAQTIASRGPIATRLAKEAVHRGSEVPLAQGLQTELDLTVILQTTEDRAEGVQAFVEKRPPQFKNR